MAVEGGKRRQKEKKEGRLNVFHSYQLAYPSMTQFSGHTEHSRFICDIPCGPRYVGSTDAFKGNYGYYSTIAPKKHTGVSKQDKIYSYVVNIWFMMKKRGM